MGESTEIIKGAYEAFRQRDLRALEEISDPEIEISSVTGILSGRETPYVGIAALVSYIRDVSTIWDSIELVPEEFHELERRQGAGLRAGQGDEERLGDDTPNAWLWTLRDGLVVSVQVYAEPSTDARWLFKR